jgi:hypothetical protein
MGKTTIKKNRKNRLTKKMKRGGGKKNKRRANKDTMSQYGPGMSPDIYYAPPPYGVPQYAPMPYYPSPAYPSISYPSPALMYHPSITVPTKQITVSKAGELIFKDRSIWMLLSSPDKIEALKTNILNLANNHVCRNITNRFNLFNSTLEAKKINTECLLLVIISIMADILKPQCALIIKGGLAVQFSISSLFKQHNIRDDDILALLKRDTDTQRELSNLFKFNSKHDEEDDIITSVYTTNDIDLLIQPNDVNAPKGMPKYYATQVSNMLSWIFEDITDADENIHVLSVQDKTAESEPSKQLIKVAIAESIGGKKPKYTAVIDINVNLPDKMYYTPTAFAPIKIDGGLKGIFTFVSVKPLILDRLKHIITYKETVRELVTTIPSLTGNAKLRDIFGGHPDFKYLMSIYRSTNALLEGLLIVELIVNKNENPLAHIKHTILDGYLRELELDPTDEELIKSFLFTPMNI